MKKTIFILFILINLNSFCQKVDTNLIIGNWEVIEIKKSPTNINFNKLIKGFEKATFHFNQDSKFEITTESSNKVFKMFNDMMSNSKWKLSKDNLILIGNEENGYSVMHIKVKFVGKKVFFDLGESEAFDLILGVKKLFK